MSSLTATAPSEKLALSIEEAASVIGVSRRTISTMLADGRLRSVAIGRRKLIPLTELRQLVATAQSSTIN
jgi:excisionase family DNA binding protein